MQQPKRTPYRNIKILRAAELEACLVNLPGCTGGGADTACAHSNQMDDGKGGSQKADDCTVAFACQHCHDILDGRKPPPWVSVQCGTPQSELIWYHDRGIKRTIRRLIDLGVLR